MISRLSFATAFVYSTKGVSDASQKSRELRDRIKKNDERLFQQMAEHVEDLVAVGAFPQFFGADVVLVPVPGHAPLAPGAVGTSQRVATALAKRGLGTVSPLLKRTKRVTKSAWATGAARPRATEHFESITFEPSLIRSNRIVLIDDFITRGATLLGAASRLQSEIGSVEIKAFALVRSITDGEIDAIRKPTVGTVELDAHGESWRQP